MATKSATQTLFDRITATWIIPEVEDRANQNLATLPYNLVKALIVWEDQNKPHIFLNEEVNNNVTKLQVIPVHPMSAGQSVTTSMIRGLKKINFGSKLGAYPFIFILQGDQGKYYVLSKRMFGITGVRDFDTLSQQLATEGVHISPSEYQMPIYIDLVRNQYAPLTTPAAKRKTVIRLRQTLIESSKRTATARVKRHLRLPTLIVHQDDELTPLLYETRQTYIDGHYFSCIASAATTADRICIRLSQRFSSSNELQKWVLSQTLGQKIQKLLAESVITTDQADLLDKINKVRNRHIHSKRPISPITLKRDAITAARLLHELIEGTVSIFRDHTIAQGRIVPKPLV